MNGKWHLDLDLTLTFIKYTVLLLLGELLAWWILFHSSMDIPEYIPETPLKISGLIRMVLFVTILVFGQKEFLRAKPDIDIFKLTLLGTLICFTEAVFFHAANQIPLMGEPFSTRMEFFLRNLLIITTFAAFLSFFVAFQLKTKKTNLLILMIIGFILLINLLQYLFPSFPG